MSKLLAEWFWTDRWMGSSAFLLPIEPRGLYREMLTQAWRRGAQLPADHEAIRRAVGCTLKEWNRCWPRIAQYWRVDGDVLVNDTQRDVWAEQSAAHERASERGRLAAYARARTQTQAQREHSSSTAQAQLEHQQSGSGSETKKEQRSKAPALARRDFHRPVENSNGTAKLYRKIAAEARDFSRSHDGSDDYSNIAEIFKQLCAERHLACDSTLATDAITAVLHAAKVSA